MSDKCGTVTLRVAYTAGSPAPASLPTGGVASSGGAGSETFARGQTIVSYTATDSAKIGRASCRVRVKITDDDTATVSSCPSNIAQGTDSSSCDALVNW